MGKYLKKFENHSNYETYINDDTTKILPNVSYCINEKDIHFNPKPINYSKRYLTFLALEDSSFTFVSENYSIYYSLNNGTTWNLLEQGNSTPVIKEGDKILWKLNYVLLDEDDNNGIGNFQATGNFEVEGNIMSLLYGDNFINQKDLS